VLAQNPALFPDGPDGRPGLVIFDCDGVLIDSEIVVCRLVGEAFTALGYPMTLDQVITRYAGRPQNEMISEIERDWGRAVPDRYFTEMKRRVADAYASELRAMPGVAAMLDALRIPFCVASSAYPEKLELGLRRTGLYDRFAPHIISASLVARGKPAPDVFVYAAGWMRMPVGRCLVVEDSIPGVRAARAAGIRVVGFVGGAHCAPNHAEALIEAGADLVISDLGELPCLVEFGAPGASVTEVSGV
jgi:HAD superfamily hydrolase (TIGR01509 family)